MRHKGAEGAAAVEFALVMIPLFLILFGIIEFGLAYNRQQAIHAATREGARVAAIGAPEEDIADAVAFAVDTVAEDDLLLKIAVTASGATPPEEGSFTAVTSSSFDSDVPCDGNEDSDRVWVAVQVNDAEEYGISIPFFGSVDQTFLSEAVFVCEPRPTS